MRVFLTAVALSLFAGAAAAQEPVRNRGDEEVRAAILKKVEERLAEFSKRLLAEVRKMLDERSGPPAAKSVGAPRKQPGYLGIEGRAVAGGILVLQSMKEAPAVKAGLRKEDVILSINGKKVTTLKELVAVLRESGAGGTAKVEYKRGDTVSTATVTLARRPQDDDDDEEEDDDDDDDDED